MKSEVDFLLDLVAIPSVSSISNRPVIDYVVQQLDSTVWQTKFYVYRDASGIEKVNLLAMTNGSDAGRDAELTLVCHTDTVPFDPDWREAVDPQVRNGKLFGRGSCDVKGFLACILAAVAQIDIAGLSRPLALLLTSDEEIGCVGAKYIARNKTFRSHCAIIGEPTGLRPVRAGKGYGLAEIIVRGQEAHSAFPARGRSAINDAARIVLALEKIAKRVAGRKNADFDPPYTTMNAGLIQGGTAKNIIPGECRITVEWRPIPGQDPAWPADLIRQELSRLKRRHPGLYAQLDVKRMDPAFQPSAQDRIANLIGSLARKRPATVAFGTEAAHLSSLAGEAIVFGPGNMETAHRTGEHVRVDDLRKCVALLKAVVGRVCNSREAAIP